MTKISVLTTVFNGGKYLAEAIESVLNQTWVNFEFIIIDDASTDNSVEIIKSYNDSRIRFFKNEKNIGQTASLNKGLKLAKSDYIARLDQDDVCLPVRLEEQYKYLENNQEVTIISSWEHTIDSSGVRVRSWESSLDNYGVFLGYLLLGLCPVWHPSVMFRKNDIIKLKGFDTDYGPAADYELWSRIALNRMNAAFVPKFHLLQRVHGSNQSLLQSDKQADSNRLAHKKLIQYFFADEDVEELVTLLRLEKSQYGGVYNKFEVREVGLKLNALMANVKDSQNLSDGEYSSLRRKILRRVGVGTLYASVITRFPNVLFYLLFYLLSPLLIPNLRTKLSIFVSYFHRLKHILKR
jgi:glycosyltransferase involved in cell wall biosynthesis